MKRKGYYAREGRTYKSSSSRMKDLIINIQEFLTLRLSEKNIATSVLETRNEEYSSS